MLPKQLELGRAARLVERLIFLGAVAAFIYYRGLPLGSLGEVNSFTDGLVLVAIVKVVAIVAGWPCSFRCGSLTISWGASSGWRRVGR